MADSSSDFLRSINDGCDFLDEPTCICDLCEQEGDQKPAVGFCSDCKDYLCQECYDTHLRPRPMRHHVLLDQHKMPKYQQQDRDRDTCTEACTVHPHKTLEYFCADHGVLGCSACMTLHHRSCEGVDHIPDIAGDILDNVEYTDLQQRITSLTQLTTTAIKTSQDQLKRSQSYHTTALDSFQTFKKDMSKAIDRMERAFNADADRIKGEDGKKAQMVEDTYKQALKGIQAVGSKFVSLQTSGQFCQLFIAMKRAKVEIDAIESQVRGQGQDTDVRNYRLVPSREAQKLLDSPETMVTLDIVTAADSVTDKQTQKVRAEPAQPVVSASSYQTLSSRPKVTDPISNVEARASRVPLQRDGCVKKTRARHVMDVHVRSRAGSDTPRISGCVVLPGDKLVLVDRDHGNVKLADLTRGDVVSRLKLLWEIRDITQVSSTQVAVTSPEGQKIYFVKVGDKLELDRKVNLKGQCHGIARINDNLVVSYLKPVKVEIISMEGKVLQAVVTEKESKQLFRSPWYIAVSKDQQTVYISDYERHTVTSVDLAGRVQATYKDDKLECPRGLTVDTVGTVYVCGSSSDNVIQLTADLTEERQLLQWSDGVARPRSICYCEATDRLYVGMRPGVVKGFKLE